MSVRNTSLFGVILTLLLTFGVGQMRGANITSDGNAILYFNMNAVNWWVASSGNGNFAYFYGTSGNAWSAHSVQQSGNYYYVKIPSGTWDHVILTRNNTSTSPSWDNKWNQTGDIELQSGKNYISAFSENSATATFATYQVTSTASLSASSTSITTAQTSTLTPSLSSNTTYNEIKSTTYSVTTNPGSAGSVTSAGVFSASAAGTYTVTATVTYNAKGFSGITKTETATKSIIVTAASTATLTYHANFAASGTSGSVPSAQEVAIDATATVAGKNTLAFTNYTFSGWNTEEHITGTDYTVGSSITMDEDKDLYAKWTRAIPLDDQDATTAVTGDVYGTYNSSSLPSFTNPAKTGYTFQGWYTQIGGGGNFVINTSREFQASKTNWTNASCQFIRPSTSTSSLYAKWTQTVTLNANTANHGSGSNRTATATWNAGSVAISTHCTPATGYKLDGYYTAATGGVKILNADKTFAATNITDYITGSKWTKAGATTLYAQYVEDLSTPLIVTGGNKIVTAGSAWRTTADENNKMLKKTGHSAESVAYFYVDVDATNNGATSNENYQFKIYKTTATTNYYGLTADGQYWVLRDNDDGVQRNLSTSGANIELRADVVGRYEIVVDYSTSTYKITVNFPTLYTVSYSVSPDGAGGAITTSPSVSSGGEVVSGTSVTFTHGDANAGYDWYRWEDGSGSSLGTGSTYTTTITGNTTVNAVYSPKTYTITLDKQTSAAGYNTSGTAAVPTVTYNATLPAITGTMPTTTGNYGFMGFYTGTLGTGLRLTDASGAWIASVEGYTDADKKWIHAGDVTLYAYYKQAEISDLTPDPAIIAPGETVTVTPTLSPAPAGTHIICWELQYSNGTALPSQPTFTPGVGNAVSFPAPSASATYRIQATLRSGSSCGGGSVLSTRVATFQVAGDHTVTVQYKCGDMTIAESVELGEIKPLTWSDDITAPSITGYTFSGWVAGDGVTIKDGESSTATTHIKATYDGTLTAVYTKKRMIYFYNTLGWESVYVYFYKNNSYWQTISPYNGTGANTTYTWTNTPYSEGLHGQMQPVSEGSSIYYFDAEAAGVNASYVDVAFTEANQHGEGYFKDTKAVRRGDYKSSIPMFVPLSDQTPDIHNGTAYTSNGYWMNYPENTGYTLKIYDAWNATKETAAVRSFAFPYSGDLKMPLKMDVEFNDANHEYWFMVYRNDGTYLGNTYNFKQGWNEEQVITGGDNKSKITTSAPGNYTLTLTYHDENYYIDVDFPIASGDYRIYYSDNATWSQGAHTKNSWNHPSHSIAKATTEAKKDTVSFFIPKGAGISHTMKFQKASVNGEGVVSWADVSGGSITIPSSVTSSGVYNFIVSQPSGGASISLEKVEPYTGNFYIRTDCAGNTKWDSFKNVDHQMTYSDYAEANSGYSHYYAHWVESGNNVSFTIANDYSMCISDTLVEDYGTTIADISNVGALNSGNASIRFMWNQATNKISRAYISGSSDISDRFLVLEGDTKMYDENGNALTTAGGGKISGLNDNEMNLIDDENFVYERTIQVNTTARAKLTAKYNNNVQYFIGGASETVELLGGAASDTKYTMRIVYDFKTNRLVTAYMPSDAAITEKLAINADIMLVREHQNAGQQLTFEGDGSLSKVKTVYGVMRFNRWTLNNKSTATGHAPVGDPKSTYERSLYWISFPFDVNLSDVFGFGTYGTHWIIEYYDGAERATEGYWKDSEGFWKYITNRRGVKLEAGKGYILALDLDLMRDNNTSFWANDIQQVELFFPSAAAVENIEKTDTEIDIPAHECTIAPRPGQTDDRRKKDSHWNIIGVPSYANYGSELKDGNNETITWNDDPKTKNLPFLYEWNMVDNSYSVQSGTTYPFKSMHAYMVQYNGKLKWSLASATPVSPVVARHADAPQDVEFRLELQAGEKAADQTFVKMSTDEQISTAFDFNYDLSKQMNSGKANIYTMVEGYIQTAGNCLPMSEQTTVVPVGVKIAADSDYTFAIPEGTEGVGVTLIDQETGIRTSLSALAYTVTLEAGTYDERFVLEISPIHNVPTDTEGVESQKPKAESRKLLIDGLLYIVRDNKMYDARGAMIMEK